ncbi:Rdx family protein [bacterium]|nr:Rdx family protein [bacterium]MBU1937762.1 Rdx family protein [bacterium]
MADFLKRNGYSEVEFIKSGGGVFEVEMDGRLLFSKRKEGRFPENDEILDNIKRIK